MDQFRHTRVRVMTQRTVFTPHPVDPAIRLVQFRRGASPVVDAEITMADGVKKLVSTKKIEITQAAFAAVSLKDKLFGIAATGASVVLRKAVNPPSAMRPTRSLTSLMRKRLARSGHTPTSQNAFSVGKAQCSPAIGPSSTPA
ncbi:hypothetical protein [Roseococcus pinisoli]|uniref:Uncharacterized protein n=1 Tax=Roseococcus pinisoli TaxID=2835040 RepID=A0ABS5QEW9_9PROT|nr:hypothetical protein [Roseococcus pinisoli]MBS7811462.1 hypothetical protein [Roseococcus pinisoli]